MLAEQPQADYIGNPQLEDGYTRIANELLKAFAKFDFSKRQSRLIFALVRRIYGWNKKSDVISLSQLQEDTGFDRANIHKTLKELEEMKVLLKQPQYNGQLIEINKKYKEWVVLLKQPHVVKTTTEVLLKQPQSVVKTTTTKETTKRKERKEVFIPEFIPRESWEGFIAMRKTIKKPMTERAMTLAIGKLHRWHLAGYSVADILDNSILNSWQDLYEPKTKPQKQYQRRSV